MRAGSKRVKCVYLEGTIGQSTTWHNRNSNVTTLHSHKNIEEEQKELWDITVTQQGCSRRENTQRGKDWGGIGGREAIMPSVTGKRWL